MSTLARQSHDAAVHLMAIKVVVNDGQKKWKPIPKRIQVSAPTAPGPGYCPLAISESAFPASGFRASIVGGFRFSVPSLARRNFGFKPDTGPVTRWSSSISSTLACASASVIFSDHQSKDQSVFLAKNNLFVSIIFQFVLAPAGHC